MELVSRAVQVCWPMLSPYVGALGRTWEQQPKAEYDALLADDEADVDVERGHHSRHPDELDDARTRGSPKPRRCRWWPALDPRPVRRILIGAILVLAINAALSRDAARHSAARGELAHGSAAGKSLGASTGITQVPKLRSASTKPQQGGGKAKGKGKGIAKAKGASSGKHQMAA